MPVTSKAQWRLMGAIRSGSAKGKGLPSKKVAAEFMHASKGSYKRLPERKPKSRGRSRAPKR
jgi:hypothetical protein